MIVCLIFIIKFINIIHLYFNGAGLLEDRRSDLVKDLIFESLLRSYAKVWIELKHSFEQIKEVTIDIREILSKKIARHTNLIILMHILASLYFCNEAHVLSAQTSKFQKDGLHLIFSLGPIFIS